MKRVDVTKKLKDQSGQLFLEAILLMVALFAVFMIVANYVLSEEFAGSMVKGPFTVVQGVIENGVYKSADETRRFHPSHQRRQLSFKGDTD